VTVVSDPSSLVKTFLRRPALAWATKRLLVACSGGADSVALLLAAAKAGGELGWQVTALHCEHGLRGKASERDAAFVMELCDRSGIPLQVFRGGLAKGAGLEERARDWRRRCYGQAAEHDRARLVLLAHHAQDQAETLLLNLLRGTGVKGAAGMQVLSPLENAPGVRLGRPLLGFSPQSLRAWLQARRQTWREDASNRDVDLARNRLRNKVLPQLLAINPKAVEHLAAFSARLRPAKGSADLAGLLKLDSAARQRAALLLAKGQGRADLGHGWVLELGAGQTRVSRDTETLAPNVPLLLGKLAWGQEWHFELKPGFADARKLKQANAYWFSQELLDQAPRLRGAKTGERMNPFGLRGSKLLRDLLAEAKVPLWRRAGWPVLEAGGTVLALPGVRRAQGLVVKPRKPAVCLSWKAPQA